MIVLLFVLFVVVVQCQSCGNGQIPSGKGCFGKSNIPWRKYVSLISQISGLLHLTKSISKPGSWKKETFGEGGTKCNRWSHKSVANI